MKLQSYACLLAIAFLAGCDCDGDPSVAERAPAMEVLEQAPPTEEELVVVATDFVLAYLKAYDAESEVDDFFGLVEPGAEFIAERDRWSVIFVGVSSLTVELDRDGKRGTVCLSDGTAITNNPDMRGRFHPEPIPLFSLSEFREVLKDHVVDAGASGGQGDSR